MLAGTAYAATTTAAMRVYWIALTRYWGRHFLTSDWRLVGPLSWRSAVRAARLYGLDKPEKLKL